jgi:hypothetical protein
VPSQRERIQMPDDEVTAMIERGRNLQVASIESRYCSLT